MAATIFSGDKVQALKNAISLNGNQEFRRVTSDPRSVAVDAPEGSIIAFGSELFRKLTSGSNTAVELLGAGASGVNFVSNSNFESNATTGWNVYADAAGTQPVDGTGGSPNITFTSTSSSPLSGTYSGLITKDAANRQGQGISTDCTISLGYRNKLTQVSFLYEASANFDFGDALNGADPSDITVWAIDTTSGAVYGLAPNTLDGSGFFKGTIQAPNSATVRLAFHISGTNANAWTLKVDDIEFSPSEASYGPNVVDVVSYTPTITTTSGTLTNGTPAGRISYVGDTATVTGSITFSGSGGTFSGLQVSLPFTIDTSKLPSSANESMILGTAHFLDNGSNFTPGIVIYNTSTRVQIYWSVVSTHTGTAPVLSTNPTGTFPATIVSGDVISWNIPNLPVVGRQSNVVVNNGDGRAVVFRAPVTGTIGGGVFSTLTIGTPTIDNTSIRSSDTLVIKEWGYYDLGGLISSNDTGWQANEQLVLSYTVNGGSENIIARTVAQATLTTRLSASGSVPVELKPGDVIRFRGFTEETTASVDESFVYAIKTPVAGTLGAGTSVRVSANTSSTTISATSLPGTAIAFSATAENTAGSSNWNGTTFTAPVSKPYVLNVSLTTNGVSGGAINQNIQLWLIKNGSTVKRISFYTFETTTSVNVNLEGSCSLGWLNAGDTIQIQGVKTSLVGTVTLSGVAGETWLDIY